MKLKLKESEKTEEDRKRQKSWCYFENKIRRVVGLNIVKTRMGRRTEFEEINKACKDGKWIKELNFPLGTMFSDDKYSFLGTMK